MSKVTVIDQMSGREKSMDRRSAEILVRLGRASYKRCDMQAEKPAPEQPDGDGQGSAQAASKPAKKAAKKATKKRTYKRRDMQAED